MTPQTITVPAATAPLSGRTLAAGAIFRPFTAFANLLAFLLFAPLGASAQVGSGSPKGKVTDVETGKPLPFVNVVLFLNGKQVTGGNTDFDGGYNINPPILCAPEWTLPSEFEAVQIIDGMDWEHAESLEYHYDNVHLRGIGAELYSQWLSPQLKAILH